MRLDIFALRENGRIDGRILGPLRPELPTLKPGRRYLLETLVRTLKLGHPLTQGTADSNEVWLELRILSGDRVLAESGMIDPSGVVDPWAKFLNAWLLDKDGQRIEQRNPEDIFVALYNHQIPPGAAELTHYAFTVPEDVGPEIRIEARVRYRKFDSRLMGHVYGSEAAERIAELPILELCADSVTLPVGSRVADMAEQLPPAPEWNRWNDYGIGLVRAAGGGGVAKGQLRQAVEAFTEVERFGRIDGSVNLARTLLLEGRIDDAGAALSRAAESSALDRPWSVDWFTAKVERERGALDEAIVRLERVRASAYPLAVERGYDFGRDDRVLLELANTQFERARLDGVDARMERLGKARDLCEEALAMNAQRGGTWYTLSRVLEALGEEERAEVARAQFELLRPDDNAQDRAIQQARRADPVANHAAEPIAIYDLDIKSRGKRISGEIENDDNAGIE